MKFKKWDKVICVYDQGTGIRVRNMITGNEYVVKCATKVGEQVGVELFDIPSKWFCYRFKLSHNVTNELEKILYGNSED